MCVYVYVRVRAHNACAYVYVPRSVCAYVPAYVCVHYTCTYVPVCVRMCMCACRHAYVITQVITHAAVLASVRIYVYVSQRLRLRVPSAANAY